MNTTNNKSNVYNGKVASFPIWHCYRSEIDGCVVVEIDTSDMPENENGPIVRVYLNEGAIFENPKVEELNTYDVYYSDGGSVGPFLTYDQARHYACRALQGLSERVVRVTCEVRPKHSPYLGGYAPGHTLSTYITQD